MHFEISLGINDLAWIVVMLFLIHTLGWLSGIGMVIRKTGRGHIFNGFWFNLEDDTSPPPR